MGHGVFTGSDDSCEAGGEVPPLEQVAPSSPFC
jgi:hypothetical protein